MPIRCQLCNQLFDKIIPYQHLRKQHGISSGQYAAEFGSSISDETRALLQARVPHNRGQKVTDAAQLAQHQQAVARRERRYQSGELTRTSTPVTASTRQKISAGMKKHAQQHPDQAALSAQKAVQTRRLRGHPGGMQGKHHSADAREKIRNSSAPAHEQSRAQSLQRRQQLLESQDVTVTHIDRQLISCQCNQCGFHFSRTYSNSNQSKIHSLGGSICPACRTQAPRRSLAEQQIAQWVRQHTQHAIQLNDRVSIAPLELDMLIPELQLAIEYCGLYWHCQAAGKSADYHQLKWRRCQQQGLRLITIFEDEWITKTAVVQHWLRSALGVCGQQLCASDCELAVLHSARAGEFLQQHHIQGQLNSDVQLGLLHQGQLVHVMTFVQHQQQWQVLQNISAGGVLITGAEQQVFDYFVQLTGANQVLAQADLRWCTGHSWGQLGFACTGITEPDVWYFQMPQMHRISGSQLPASECEHWHQIWDCGHSCWRWSRQDLSCLEHSTAV